MPERYGDWSPTQFDQKGSNLDDRQDWLVCPVMETRDSGPFDKSNFYSCLDILGGESDAVEIHTFNHWGPGWLSIILVHPSREKEVEDIERSLENYPVLDEEDLSEREYEAMQEDWNSWAARDFEKELLRCLENMANEEPEGSGIEQALQHEKDLDDFMPDGGMTYRMAGVEPPTDSERLWRRIEEIENWSSDQLRAFAFDDCEMEWESHDSGTSFKIDKAVSRAIRHELFWEDPVFEKENAQ